MGLRMRARGCTLSVQQAVGDREVMEQGSDD